MNCKQNKDNRCKVDGHVCVDETLCKTGELKHPKREPQEIIYRALLAGVIIEKDGKTYAMAEDGGVATKFIREGEVMWLKCDLTMEGFYKWCNTFTEDELFLISANKVLAGDK